MVNTAMVNNAKWDTLAKEAGLHAPYHHMFSKDVKEDLYLRGIIYGANMNTAVNAAKSDIKKARYYFFMSGLVSDGDQTDILYKYARKKYNVIFIHDWACYPYPGCIKYDSVMASALEKRQIPNLGKMEMEALRDYDRLHHTNGYAYIYDKKR